MKAIIVTEQRQGIAGMSLADRPEPHAAENDVVVEVHAAGFTRGELDWPGTWTDRAGRDRTPSIPGHELAGVVTSLGYGTTGLQLGQRVFGFADWTRDGSLAEYVAVEARNLAPLPADLDMVTAAALPISGLTAWQGIHVHARLEAGQTILVHGVAGAVGSMAAQLARRIGARVIGTGRAGHRPIAERLGVSEFLDLEAGELDGLGPVDVVFDVLGGDIGERSMRLVRPGGSFITIAEPPRTEIPGVRSVFFVVEPDRGELTEIARLLRAGHLELTPPRTVGLHEAAGALAGRNPGGGRTIVVVRESGAMS